MEHKYSLENIFTSWLSYKGISYAVPPKLSRSNENNSFNITPAIFKNTMTKGNADYYRNGVYMPVILGGVNIPFAVTTIGRSKNIVKTSLQGRTGAVKELISINDSTISITGMVIGLNREYPENEVNAINKLFEQNEAVEIVHPLSSILFDSNTKVVIESIDFPPLKGVEDAQIITIKCITDTPFELKIK